MWEQLLISMLPGILSFFSGKTGSTLSNFAGLFGQGYQTAQNYQIQQQNLEWQRNFAMQQFNYNRMLNDRSFFNSLPSSQISHFLNAGLSPDLLYGQLSSMDYGNNQSLQMPNASAPNFSGLENANLLKDLSKKDTEIGLNLSQKELNKVNKDLKDLDVAFRNIVDNYRINKELWQAEFVKINNSLVSANVEQNVINNMKMAASLGLVRSIDENGNVHYSTSEKFREVTDMYLKDLKQKYDIGEEELNRIKKSIDKLDVDIKTLNSEILINSVAYQQDVMNLIASAVGVGIDLKQDAEGNWIVDYSGSTGDVAGVVAMGLIDSVLSAVGIKFSLGKNASRVLGKYETTNKSVIKSENLNTNMNKNIY